MQTRLLLSNIFEEYCKVRGVRSHQPRLLESAKLHEEIDSNCVRRAHDDIHPSSLWQQASVGTVSQ